MSVSTRHRPLSAVRQPRSSRPARLVHHHSDTPRSSVSVGKLMSAANVAEPDAPLLEIVYRMLSLGQREIVVVDGRRVLGVITLAELAALADPAASSGQRYARDLLPSRT